MAMKKKAKAKAKAKKAKKSRAAPKSNKKKVVRRRKTPRQRFGAAAALVAVELEKTNDSPPLVRVTSPDATGIVIRPHATKGNIPNCTVGSFVSIDIDVTGNPGAKATINIKRAIPTSVVVKIPGNTGQAFISQSLQVTG